MRISDWSSDVCSSDLASGNDPRSPRNATIPRRRADAARVRNTRPRSWSGCARTGAGAAGIAAKARPASRREDRKSVVEGKSGSVRVDLGGRRIIKKKKTEAKEGDEKEKQQQTT